MTESQHTRATNPPMSRRASNVLQACALLTLQLACANPSTDAKQLQSAAASGTSEPHRPRFHFTPDSGWMNDPNGLVYYAGTWHLFYQYYPDSTVWGPMHWGHATSADLVHWERRPIALAPDSLGYIFSGSAVVDAANTSGLGSAENPPLVAMFTYHDMAAEKAGSRRVESQAIAFSIDSGRTWTKYAGNPVIPNPGEQRDFRDPKLVRDEARNQWVVVLAVGDHAEFWSSRDLTSWKKVSEFGAGYGSHAGVWECPDFRPMRVEGSGETKWVLIQNINPGHPNGGTGAQYFVGDFDGTTFTLDARLAAEVRDGKAIWLDEGRDDYAGVTWSNAPDGRVVFLGWMSNWSYAQQVPTTRWRSATTVPRELTLQLTPRGYRLITRPVRELEALRSGEVSLADGALSGTRELDVNSTPDAVTMELELAIVVPKDAASRAGLELRNAKGERFRVGYDAGAQAYFSDRTAAGKNDFSPDFAPRVSTAARQAPGDTVRMHIFVDVASMELFADDGLQTMTEIYFPSTPFDRVALFSEGGEVKLVGGKSWMLAR